MGLNFKHPFNYRLYSKDNDESWSIVFLCSDNKTSSFFKWNHLWKLYIWFVSRSFFSIHRLSLLFIFVSWRSLILSIFLCIRPWDFSQSFVCSASKDSYFWLVLTSSFLNMGHLFNAIKVNLCLLLFKLVLRVIWILEIPDVDHCIKTCWNKAKIIIEPGYWFYFSSVILENHVRSALSGIKVENHDRVCICTGKVMTSIWKLYLSAWLNVNLFILL